MSGRAAHQASPRSPIREPEKLLRLALSIRNALNEVRTVELDETAVQRLHELHQRAIGSIKELLSPDLRQEFEQDIELPAADAGSSQAALQVAQGRLIGWLEGLFRGMRASALDDRIHSALERAADAHVTTLPADGDQGDGGYI